MNQRERGFYSFGERWFGRWGIVGVLVLSGVISTYRLGHIPFWGWDEGGYAAASREMLSQSNWLIPTFNGRMISEKPILFYWLEMASFSLFGANEFTARLPSALASIATTYVSYLLGYSLYGWTTGILAGLVYSTFILVAVTSQLATCDAIFSLFLISCLFCFWKTYQSQNMLWKFGCGLTAGLAVLTKGPVGLVWHFCALAGYFGVFKAKKTGSKSGWMLPLGLLCVIVFPWYVYVSQYSKGNFPEEFFLLHNLKRFLIPMNNSNGSAFYYLISLFVWTSPWTGFLILKSYKFLKRPKGNRNITQETKLLISWIVFPTLFLSLCATKWSNYALPLYPVLAILIATEIRSLLNGKTRSWEVGLIAFSLIVTASLVITPLFSFGWWTRNLQLASVVSVSHLALVLLALSAALGGYILFGINQKASFVFQVGHFIAFTLLFRHNFFAPPLQYDPLRNLSNTIQKYAKPDTELIGVCIFPDWQPGLQFYFPKPLRWLTSVVECKSFLASHPTAYLLQSRKIWEDPLIKMPIIANIMGTFTNPIDDMDFVILSNKSANVEKRVL